ncbi:MAG TPA: methyltransferase domain-containing protein [Bryobacteraceae bacterium]|nr:methyltransferase domain-containing protein [Bryobacteraceae bacterium]
MLDLIRNLPDRARVLDLGAGTGSFPSERPGLRVVRLDLERPHSLGDGAYVLADAARMPFRTASFDLIVSNHSLEHFVELKATLREIGRVIKPDGVLYVSVPDASTLSDRIYRWLGRGGGHVNPFRSPGEVAAMVTTLTALPLRSTTVLFSSLAFLNRHNFVTRPPRRIALFAFGNEIFLTIAIWMLRGLDRRCGTRLSHYGWSFRFGNVAGSTEEPWVNVCVRCGAGHSELYLRKHVAFRRALGLVPAYRCPACGGFNFLTREFPTPPA